MFLLMLIIQHCSTIPDFWVLITGPVFVISFPIFGMSVDLSNKCSTLYLDDTHPSLDYEVFKCNTIHPSVANSRIQALMGTPRVSITFPSEHLSVNNNSQFFENTNYMHTTSSKPLSSLTCSGDFVYEPVIHLQGYISPKRPDYFVWEYGFFKEGVMMILGEDLRLARVTRVEGVGRNFIKFGVEALGSPSKDEISVRRMIIFFPPDSFCLTQFQCFKLQYFRKFLKSMRDIVDENRDWDDLKMQVQRDSNMDYGKICLVS